MITDRISPWPAGDNVINCTQIQNAFGGGYYGLATATGMGCYDMQADTEETARSMHPDGVNVCFADGSIHWISDYIQASPSYPSALSVWDRLMLSADGQPVDSSAF